MNQPTEIALFAIFFVWNLVLTWFIWRLLKHFVSLDFRIGLANAVANKASDVALSTKKWALERYRIAVEDTTKILSDPALLDAELERSGQLSEARRARRRHLVRENAGPPAKIHKVNITKK